MIKRIAVRAVLFAFSDTFRKRMMEDTCNHDWRFMCETKRPVFKKNDGYIGDVEVLVERCKKCGKIKRT